MITYSIRPKTVWQGIKDITRGFIPSANDRPARTWPKLNDRWSKERYTTFIEQVKQQFKQGDLVTLKSIQPIKNLLPIHYKVSYIDELHYTVKYDSFYMEPAAVVAQGMDGILIPRAPISLRQLTKEELELVHLHNTKPATPVSQ